MSKKEDASEAGNTNRPTDSAAVSEPVGSEGFTLIIPTRDEAPNIKPLVTRIAAAVAQLPVKLLFIDDSNDDTVATIEAVTREVSLPVRVIHRSEPRDGLGGAVVAGMEAATTAWVIVMDADLQHPPEQLPRLIAATGAVETGASTAGVPTEAAFTDGAPGTAVADAGKASAEEGTVTDAAGGETAGAETTATNPVKTPVNDASSGVDIVVGSRFVAGGSSEGLSGPFRVFLSGFSVRLVKILFPRRLREVTDPMSGLFALRIARINVNELRPRGFKILLEILVRNHLRLTEVPATLAAREAGESKADFRQGWRLTRQITRLRFAKWFHPG